MSTLDVGLLERLHEELPSDLSNRFQTIVIALKELFYCDPLIRLANTPQIVSVQNYPEEEISVFTFGVQRRLDSSGKRITSLIFNATYQEFIPFLFLREAIYCYIPPETLHNDFVPLFINTIIEIQLKSHPFLKKWSNLILQYSATNENLKADLDRIDKYFMLQSEEPSLSSISLFIQFLRSNASGLGTKQAFYKTVFLDKYYKTLDLLYSDERIEALRILYQLFYREKKIHSQIEYFELFKQYKKTGTFHTTLSFRKFRETVQYLRDFSDIGPSFDINKFYFGYANYQVQLLFHPALSYRQARELIKHLPWITATKIALDGFCLSILINILVIHEYRRDFLAYLDDLKSKGLIVSYTHVRTESNNNLLNLNYYREFHQRNYALSPDLKGYDPKYEILYSFNHHPEKVKIRPFNIPETYFFDRSWRWSISGFSFSDMTQALRLIKEDIRRYRTNQLSLLWTLKKNSTIIRSHTILKVFQSLYNEHKKDGFFVFKEYIANLTYCLTSITENSDLYSITSLGELESYLNRFGLSKNIQKNLQLTAPVKNTLQKKLLPLFLRDKQQFKLLSEYLDVIKNTLQACFDLKILNLGDILKIIQTPSYMQTIFEAKEQKIRAIKDQLRKRIKREDIKYILEDFLAQDPPIINPYMISTIMVSPFSPVVFEFYGKIVVNQISSYFRQIIPYTPKTIIAMDQHHMLIEAFSVGLTTEEKATFVSAFYNLFGQEIKARRFFFSGAYSGVYLPEYYDFTENRFFYTPVLYEQLRALSWTIYKRLPSFQKVGNLRGAPEPLFLNDKTLMELSTDMISRRRKETITLDLKSLQELKDILHHVSKQFQSFENFIQFTASKTFRTYVKKVRLLPLYQKLGLAEYRTIIQPTEYAQLDLKLFLHNTFTSLKTSLAFDDLTTLYTKQLFPYRTPNLSHINWLAKSKNGVLSYCNFFVKKVHVLFHYDTNLGPNGWEIDKGGLLNHLQRVLYEERFERDKSRITTIPIADLPEDTLIAHETEAYNAFLSLYSPSIKDYTPLLKSKEGFSIFSALQAAHGLFEPVLSLENLGLEETFYFIFPNITSSQKEKLVSAFTFFNYGKIYEIEGESYIYGQKEVPFEEGLLVKLYFPPVQFSEVLLQLLDLFTVLDLNLVGMVSDLGAAHQALEQCFSVQELGDYRHHNILLNLSWSAKDRKYLNPPLYTEQFVPIYPPLIRPEKDRQ